MPRRLPTLTAALLALPGTALAHHPTGGTAPQSLLEGLLSGIGHPVIGIDHLAFIIAAGVLAAGAATRDARIALPLVFLAAGLVGTLLHLGGTGLGPVEMAIAASLLAAGGLLLRRATTPAPLLALLF
ncbi:MAG: HupE/UreJ family protein, partial [Acetobacteraceae bacterium]|nr:HupE/UreJ family protein [Acetobacteraceae bacterium]